MPATLTIAGSGYNGTYAIADNTTYVSSAATLAAGEAYVSKVGVNGGTKNVTFNQADSVTITGGPLVGTNLSISAGNDTLVVSAALTGSGVGAEPKIDMGSGNDLVTVNAAATNYSFQAGSGNDTLIINAASSGTTFGGNVGADSITVNANLTGGQVAGGTSKTDGNDTIVFATGVTVSGVLVNGFDIAADRLVIGTTTITAADFTAAGAVIGNNLSSVVNTGNNADIGVLNAWLAAGGNKITLI
jgi:hypothetical protein